MIRIVEMNDCVYDEALDTKLIYAQNTAIRIATSRQNHSKNVIVDIIYDSSKNKYRVAEFVNQQHDKLGRNEHIVYQLFKKPNSSVCTVRRYSYD